MAASAAEEACDHAPDHPDGPPPGAAADLPPTEGDGAPDLATLRRRVALIEGRLAAEARLTLPATGVTGRSGNGTGRSVASEPRPPAVPSPAGAATRAAPGRLALGVPALDALFAGEGLPMAALTELRAAETRQAGALTGLVAALAVRIGDERPGPLLWVREGRLAHEAGRPAALGLLHLGLDPGRLIAIEVRDAAEALWAAEEGLACPGLSAVVCELQGLPRAFDLTASRRLALRARHHGLPLLIAGHGTPEAASAAAVRMAVAARPSVAAGGFDLGPGHPAWTLTLEKNRDGRTGRADLAWHADERAFHALDPLSLPVAPDAPHGPARPDRVGQVVAYPVRRAG